MGEQRQEKDRTMVWETTHNAKDCHDWAAAKNIGLASAVFPSVLLLNIFVWNENVF